MQNIAPSFKDLEPEQEMCAPFQRSNKRRNGIIIPVSAPAYEEIQKKISEPTTMSSLGSAGSV